METVRKRPVVLVFGQDPDTLTMLRMSLECRLAVTVIPALSSAAGWQWLVELGPGAVDLIIGHYPAATLGGLTFLEDARGRYPSVPCVLLTGFADAALAIAAGNDAGVVTFLSGRQPATALQSFVPALEA